MGILEFSSSTILVIGEPLHFLSVGPLMEISSNFYRHPRFLGRNLSYIVLKCLGLLVIALFLRAILLPSFSDYGGIDQYNTELIQGHSFPLDSQYVVRQDRFLEVPQIVLGLNNQKIAFAKACLTARMLNRTLLVPTFSASLLFGEGVTPRWLPISFEKVFQFERFNSLCNGFVQLGRYSDLRNQTVMCQLPKGSGEKWTIERDLDQLWQYSQDPFDRYEIIRIDTGPFFWHDHWPVKDYARVFECLVLVDDIAREAAKVVSKIREAGKEVLRTRTESAQTDVSGSSLHSVPYVAVHTRIEKDWLPHCKMLERKRKITQICSSKQEMMERVGNIVGLKKPAVLYLAVADSLLEEDSISILNGWGQGFVPYEKKKLGVNTIYSKYPYLIQAAIDYEVCLRADVFVGNSFSTFSSLIALERTQKLIGIGVTSSCGMDVRWPSYAYNVLGESNGPHKWMTNMSDSSLRAISYGSNNISCSSL